MNCAEARLLLHAHADGELDVTHGLELERHLVTCGACSAEHKSTQSLKEALRQPALLYRAPTSLRQEVRRLAQPPRGATPSWFQSLLLWRSIAFGATVLAVLTLVVRPALPGQDTLVSEAVASHVRSLMPGHLTDVASSDQHTVKPWFDGKVDFAPNVKDFADEGFPLEGGRLDFLNGRSVAALVYRRHKHVINVYVWPATEARDSRSTISSRRGYRVIQREAGGWHYCLVSDLNEKELMELGRLVGG